MGGTIMRVGEIMTKPVIATTPRASVRDIATQLVTNGFSGMPVAQKDGTVIGIITEYDILMAISEGTPLEKLIAEEIMTKAPLTVDVDTEVEEAIRLFEERVILRVPVTNKGKLVGILSRVDVIKSALEPEFITFS
jgi:predicted transcriptional regulator